jgi:hypothetical protein
MTDPFFMSEIRELNAKAQGREDAKAKDFPRERAELYGVANLFT